MTKQQKYGIILQYAQMALSILINLIYTPIMLKILGQNQYGIYNLASSIISYLSLLSLGFAASYIRFYSRYKSEKSEESIKKLNGLYLIVFLIIGAIALAAGLALAFNSQIFFNSTYSQVDIKTAKILMIFLAVNLAMSFPGSVFSSYISSQEKFIFQKIVNIGTTIISPCLCIAFLYLGYGSIGMVVITTAISVIVNIINIFYCLFKLKMQFKFCKFDKQLFKEIAVFSIFIAINQVIDQINWQTDKIILGKMINGSAVAIYAVGATINTMYLNFSTAISNVFTPQVHRIVNENAPDMDNKLTDLFIKVGKIQFYVIMLVLTGFIFFGKYFVKKWAGQDYALSYYIALCLICPVTISLIQNVGIEIQRAKNLHKFRSIVYLIMAVLNIGISILLCHLCGIIGVAIGTTISLFVANIVIMNIYYHKKVKINVVRFWIEIAKLLPYLVLPCLFGTLLDIFYHYQGLWDFVLLVLAYIFVYCVSMYFIGFNKTTREMICQKIKNVFKRKKSDDQYNEQN